MENTVAILEVDTYILYILSRTGRVTYLDKNLSNAIPEFSFKIASLMCS